MHTPSNIFISMTGIDRSAILSKIPPFLILKQGKDVCDCIISPMKGAICRYCNEGHNILTTADMHNALEVTERKLKLRASIISAFCQFCLLKDVLCLSKAYGVGNANLIPYSELVLEKQGLVVLREVENHGFFATAP